MFMDYYSNFHIECFYEDFCCEISWPKQQVENKARYQIIARTYEDLLLKNRISSSYRASKFGVLETWSSHVNDTLEEK